MAGRPKKTDAITKTVKKTEVVDNTLEQIEALQKQLKELMAENEKLKTEKEKEDVTVNTEVEVEDIEEELTADTEIPVVSQTIGALNISTEGSGIGTLYRFEEFGEIQDIPFGDLKLIVKNQPTFAKSGVFFICNPIAVKKLRLGNSYKNLIDNKTFDKLFDIDSKAFIALYESAPKLQQEQVVSLIEERLEKGLEVDGNVLIKIGQLCGKDFLANEI